MKIVVTPERLRELGNDFSREANTISQIDNKLRHAAANLDWETRQKANIEGKVRAIQSLASGLIGETQEISRFLNQKAQTFQETDNRGYHPNFAQPLHDLPFHLLYMNPDLWKQLPEEIRQLVIGDRRLLVPFWSFQKIVEYLNGLGIDLRGIVADIPYWLMMSSPSVILGVGLLEGFFNDPNQQKNIIKLLLERGLDSKGFKSGVKELLKAYKLPDELMKSIPLIGIAFGTALDYYYSDDHSWRGFRVALGKNIIEAAIEAPPIGKAVMLANSLNQIIGEASIQGQESQGMRYCIDPMHDRLIARSAAEARYVLHKQDLENLTEDLSKLANDQYVEPYIDAHHDLQRDPSMGNIAKARLLENPMIGPPVYSLIDSDVGAMVIRDSKSFLGHTGDILVAQGEKHVAQAKYEITVKGAMLSEWAERSLPPTLGKKVSSTCDSVLINISSIPPVPSLAGEEVEYPLEGTNSW